jgi:hypothetical protein
MRFLEPGTSGDSNRKRAEIVQLLTHANTAGNLDALHAWLSLATRVSEQRLCSGEQQSDVSLVDQMHFKIAGFSGRQVGSAQLWVELKNRQAAQPIGHFISCGLEKNCFHV